MVAVRIDGVSKAYVSHQPVLDEISLSVQDGEVFFLLGPSGCGKTTLLRMIAGFVSPDQGRVHFDDQDVTELPTESRGVGMVFQNYALWPHLNVSANVAFGLEIQGVAAAERRRRVEEALGLVELTDFGDRRISELSGGQQQRVALARAIVTKPRVLLLDEPLSNLDARLRTAMRAEIRRVCKASGLTAIYVTHDQAEALSTADRIALLSGGRVAQVGTPRELYDSPANRTVAAFVGEANLISGLITGTTLRTAIGTLRPRKLPRGLAEGAQVTICLRPERLRFVGSEGQEENRIEASIDEAGYLGASALWRVVAGSSRTPVMVAEACPPNRKPGDAVMLAIAPEDVLVLSA
jgi:iron(III) transport system ATP-binding protein